MKGIWLKKLIAGLAVTAMIAGTLSGCSAMDGLNININENGVTVDEKADASREETGAEEEKAGAELEYWTEGSAAAASITDYVKKVTDESSDDFIPVEDRIAVFDLDGTLMGELYPSYFEYMMFIHRALYDEDYEAPEDMMVFAQELNDAVHKQGAMPDNSERLHAEYAGKAYAGMTPDE
nr:hypothetical protein [Lachnospiraceae bacterium]